MPIALPRDLFDTIRVLNDGRWQNLAIEQFLELPLSDRIRHVIKRTVVFERAGEEVEQKAALAELRRLRATALQQHNAARRGAT